MADFEIRLSAERRLKGELRQSGVILGSGVLADGVDFRDLDKAFKSRAITIVPLVKELPPQPPPKVTTDAPKPDVTTDSVESSKADAASKRRK
jgi:hypothetical protein